MKIILLFTFVLSYSIFHTTSLVNCTNMDIIMDKALQIDTIVYSVMQHSHTDPNKHIGGTQANEYLVNNLKLSPHFLETFYKLWQHLKPHIMEYKGGRRILSNETIKLYKEVIKHVIPSYARPVKWGRNPIKYMRQHNSEERHQNFLTKLFRSDKIINQSSQIITEFGDTISNYDDDSKKFKKLVDDVVKNVTEQLANQSAEELIIDLLDEVIKMNKESYSYMCFTRYTLMSAQKYMNRINRGHRNCITLDSELQFTNLNLSMHRMTNAMNNLYLKINQEKLNLFNSITVTKKEEQRLLTNLYKGITHGLKTLNLWPQRYRHPCHAVDFHALLVSYSIKNNLIDRRMSKYDIENMPKPQNITLYQYIKGYHEAESVLAHPMTQGKRLVDVGLVGPFILIELPTLLHTTLNKKINTTERLPGLNKNPCLYAKSTIPVDLLESIEQQLNLISIVTVKNVILNAKDIARILNQDNETLGRMIDGFNSIMTTMVETNITLIKGNLSAEVFDVFMVVLDERYGRLTGGHLHHGVELMAELSETVEATYFKISSIVQEKLEDARENGINSYKINNRNDLIEFLWTRADQDPETVTEILAALERAIAKMNPNIRLLKERLAVLKNLTDNMNFTFRASASEIGAIVVGNLTSEFQLAFDDRLNRIRHESNLFARSKRAIVSSIKFVKKLVASLPISTLLAAMFESILIGTLRNPIVTERFTNTVSSIAPGKLDFTAATFIQDFKYLYPSPLNEFLLRVILQFPQISMTPKLKILISNTENLLNQVISKSNKSIANIAHDITDDNMTFMATIIDAFYSAIIMTEQFIDRQPTSATVESKWMQQLGGYFGDAAMNAYGMVETKNSWFGKILFNINLHIAREVGNFTNQKSTTATTDFPARVERNEVPVVRMRRTITATLMTQIEALKQKLVDLGYQSNLDRLGQSILNIDLMVNQGKNTERLVSAINPQLSSQLNPPTIQHTSSTSTSITTTDVTKNAKSNKSQQTSTLWTTSMIIMAILLIGFVIVLIVCKRNHQNEDEPNTSEKTMSTTKVKVILPEYPWYSDSDDTMSSPDASRLISLTCESSYVDITAPTPTPAAETVEAKSEKELTVDSTQSISEQDQGKQMDVKLAVINWCEAFETDPRSTADAKIGVSLHESINEAGITQKQTNQTNRETVIKVMKGNITLTKLRSPENKKTK